MKKALLHTTAIASVTLLASVAIAQEKKTENQPVKLGLGGYFNIFFGAGDDTLQNRREHHIARDSEIYFQGTTQLDNGLTVGATVQLEGETCSDQIDESFIYFEHEYGRLELGARNGAYVKPAYTTPQGFLGVNTPSVNFINAPTRTNGTGVASGTTGGAESFDLAGDSEKITYYTPRIMGLQLGVSYTPETAEAGLIDGGIGVQGSTFQPNNGAHDVENIWEFSGNFTETFGDLGVTAFGGTSLGQLENHNGGATTGRSGDPTSYQFGLGLSYMGFNVGGQYGHQDNNRATFAAGGATGSTDSDFYSAGINYVTGSWTVGFQYVNMDVEYQNGTRKQADQLDSFEVGTTYNVGPGINVGTSVIWHDYSSPNLGANISSDAWVWVVGTMISF